MEGGLDLRESQGKEKGDRERERKRERERRHGVIPDGREG